MKKHHMPPLMSEEKIQFLRSILYTFGCTSVFLLFVVIYNEVYG